jgi:23S rRNA (guanosine2251-2'-O)-methyltransferase
MNEVWKCINPECGLRYSVAAGDRGVNRCPRCRSDARLVISGISQQTVPGYFIPPTNPILKIQIVLDNIRSAGNVGSIFRSADGAGITCLHLCGVTPTAENAGVKKTALGAEESIPWIYHADGVQAVAQLKASGNLIWALEGGSRASPLMDEIVPDSGSLVLVVGNELGGVDPGIIDLSDSVVYLPMVGLKGSLNVAVACGIAVYWLRFLFGSTNQVIPSE